MLLSGDRADQTGQLATILDAYQDFYDFDVSTLRLVEPLRGLASARLRQITNRNAAERALERVVDVVNRDPNADIPDKVRATIDLADMYNITGDRRAADTYLQAWSLMKDDPRHQELSADIFGSPTRLHPEATTVLYLDRMPDAKLKEPDVTLFIEVEFTVRANGRVQNIKLLDKNVPNEQVRLIRARLSDARYRPRMMDGVLVDTDSLVMTQTYEVRPPTSNSPGVRLRTGDSRLSENKLP